jgi:hypothetical protein
MNTKHKACTEQRWSLIILVQDYIIDNFLFCSILYTFKNVLFKFLKLIIKYCDHWIQYYFETSNFSSRLLSDTYHRFAYYFVFLPLLTCFYHLLGYLKKMYYLFLNLYNLFTYKLLPLFCIHPYVHVLYFHRVMTYLCNMFQTITIFSTHLPSVCVVLPFFCSLLLFVFACYCIAIC